MSTAMRERDVQWNDEMTCNHGALRGLASKSWVGGWMMAQKTQS